MCVCVRMCVCVYVYKHRFLYEWMWFPQVKIFYILKSNISWLSVKECLVFCQDLFFIWWRKCRKRQRKQWRWQFMVKYRQANTLNIKEKKWCISLWNILSRIENQGIINWTCFGSFFLQLFFQLINNKKKILSPIYRLDDANCYTLSKCINGKISRFQDSQHIKCPKKKKRKKKRQPRKSYYQGF